MSALPSPACRRQRPELDAEVVDVRGGAIAIGRPVGAGLAIIGIGVGQGMAVVLHA